MTSPVRFGNQQVQLNNRHFENLLDFALEIAPQFATTATDKAELERIVALQQNGMFWPGRGLILEEDFETVAQLKFWARVFLETSQSVFLREVGSQDNSAWQAQMIYFAEAVARLFLAAIWEQEGGRWFPKTRVEAEFKALSGS